MTALRRTGTILGWSAGVCGVVYLAWLSYVFSIAQDLPVPFSVQLGVVMLSPFAGGIVGVVLAVRGASTRDKVLWSVIGLVLMVPAWYALAFTGILILELLFDLAS